MIVVGLLVVVGVFVIVELSLLVAAEQNKSMSLFIVE